MKSSISIFGVPTRLIADQGRSFTGTKFMQFCSNQKIQLHLVATGASRANGQVERVMSTLKNLLTAVETSSRSWQDALGDVQLALNCTINRSTKCSPLELLIGKVARPLGLIPISDTETEIDKIKLRELADKNMKEAARYEKTQFDKNKAKVIRFSVGDFVLLKNSERQQTKLDPKFRGPFLVVEVLDGDRYVLKSTQNNRRYKYPHESLRKLPDVQIPEELDVNNEEQIQLEEPIETE
nr:uncharacterized protein LOC121502211 [Drosophila kikkawai]